MDRLPAHLQQHPLLAPLTAGQQAELNEHIQHTQLTRSDYVHRQGDSVQHLGILVSGALKAFRIMQTGQEKIFQILGPGDCFGESALFLPDHRYLCTVQAVQDSEILLLPVSLFRQLVTQNPLLANNLIQQLVQMEADNMEALEILSLNKSMHRVIRYLLMQALQDCSACSALQFELPAAKRLIASQLSIQPETLSRILRQLEQEGLLQISGRRICILDLDALISHDRQQKV